jgi:hypothetical protein
MFGEVYAGDGTRATIGGARGAGIQNLQKDLYTIQERDTMKVEGQKEPQCA